MARTKGAKNRYPADDPRSNMHTPKTGIRIATMPSEERLDVKYKILALLSAGEAVTVSEAARAIGVDPHKVWSWGRTDPDFKEAIAAAREVAADDIEKRLQTHGHFIPQMFLLKAYREEFRDNYHPNSIDSKMAEILEELRKKAQQESTAPTITIIPAPYITNTTGSPVPYPATTAGQK